MENQEYEGDLILISRLREFFSFVAWNETYIRLVDIFHTIHEGVQEQLEPFGDMDQYPASEKEFVPENQVNISAIEKGIFICYEIKSCKEDFRSGFGQNYFGEKNYLVMPMSVYKEVIRDIPHNVGVLVPIPLYADKYQEFENPTPLDKEKHWKLHAIKPAHIQGRKKSMTELLFCMLRSARN